MGVFDAAWLGATIRLATPLILASSGELRLRTSRSSQHRLGGNDPGRRLLFVPGGLAYG